MRKYVIILSCAALVFSSCSPDAGKKAAEIKKLEDLVTENGKKGIADTANVKILMADYKAYAIAFPKDSLSPAFLMKLAKFYDFIALPDSAIYYYDFVYKQCPSFPKNDVALFSEAFIYENEKHNFPKAGMLYNEYLKNFPASNLAKSVKFELVNLGKSPEQVMAEIDSVRKARQADSTETAGK